MTAVFVVIPEELPVAAAGEIKPRVFANVSIVPSPKVLQDRTIRASVVTNLSRVPSGAVSVLPFVEIDASVVINTSVVPGGAVTPVGTLLIRPTTITNTSTVPSGSVVVRGADGVIRPTTVVNTSSVPSPTVVQDETSVRDDDNDPLVGGGVVGGRVI